jgi:DNA-binding MarR family transcriptional regulator
MQLSPDRAAARAGPGTVPPPVATLTAALVEMVSRFHREFVRRLRKEGLTLSQFWVLFHLRRLVPATPGRLANELGVTLPSVTHALNELESRGYLVRGHDPKDRRLVPLRITPAGERKAEILGRLLKEGVQRSLPEVSTEDWQAFQRVLTGLRVFPPGEPVATPPAPLEEG